MNQQTQTYQLVTLHIPSSMKRYLEEIKEMAMECQCDGVEEFSLEESTVDEILGERSYSGGDLPLEVLLEVERNIQGEGRDLTLKFYFCQEQAQDQANQFRSRVGGPYPSLAFQQEEKAQEDWNAQWKEHFSPIVISPLLEIVPSWEKGLYQSHSLYPLYIYPGMAFGTGGHETTFLCLQFLSEKINRREHESEARCLDFGCGSGILGIAAAKWGFGKVDLIDIDEEALKNCRENIQLNFESTDAFNLSLGTPQELAAFDLIFANILEKTLVQSRDLLLGALRPQGMLVLSGLLNDQVDGVLSWYLSHPKIKMRPVDHSCKGDWSALLLVKEGESL